MESAFILIAASIIISFLVVLYFVNRKLSEMATGGNNTQTEWLRSTNQRMEEIGKKLDDQAKTLNQAMSESSKVINESLSRQTDQLLTAQRAIYAKLAESAKTIGEMSEIGKSMKDLQQFLASPKIRGGLGEQVLAQLLEQVLPKASFSLQYSFRAGVKVDAIIKTSSGIIPIDSKFSMENFKKMNSVDTEKERDSYKKLFISDTKDRIDEVAKKYILPDEGTVDFAMMYVPSEAVYYEIVNSDKDLMEYAYRKRVMPVSPSTFYAFLRSVLLSFEGQKIAAEIRTIQQALRSIHGETEKFGDLLSTLQTHVTNAYSMMNKVATSFVGLSSKVEGVRGLGAGHSDSTKEIEG